MTKLEYLKNIFNNGAYGEKAVMQSILTIQFEDKESSGYFEENIPNSVFIKDGKFKTKVGNEVITLEGNTKLPFITVDEILELPKDFHPILKGKSIRTTFGLLLTNVVVLWDSFKGKVDYINKEMTSKVIENIIKDLMVDNPVDGKPVPENKASVDDCLKVSTGLNYLLGVSYYFNKPGGLDAVSVDPKVLALRDKLFEENKDKLNDPVVFTKIIDQVVALDRDIQLSGPSKNFYINDGFISNARSRMFIAFGIEEDPTSGEWRPITNSLDDGPDTSLITTYINSLIAGMYDRGKATGDGGARVKETLRLFSRTKIIEDKDDCGSKVGERVLVREESKNIWVGAYYLNNRGNVVSVTKSNIDSLVGKYVNMRVPQFCLAEDDNYCKTCVGDKLGYTRDRLPTDVSDIASAMMYRRMKGAHQAARTTAKLNLNMAIKP